MNDYSEEDIKLLHEKGFRFEKDMYRETYHVLFRPLWNKCCPSIKIWNKELLDRVLSLLKTGHDIESNIIREMLSEKPEGDTYEFDRSAVRSHRMKKNRETGKEKPVYARGSWGLRYRNIVEEHVGYYVTLDIPNGDFADGRTNSYIHYKSLEEVKKMAIEYIDKQIEEANAYKGAIENE